MPYAAWSLIPALVFALAACSSPRTDPPATPPTGTLTVIIEGLPQGLDAAVTVASGDYSADVTQSVELELPVGVYTVTAEEVEDYLADPNVQSVTVTAESGAEAQVRYVTVPAPHLPPVRPPAEPTPPG